ncbi:orotidine-5'-phosphate decarboxylase [Friedmanniella endophytica]|uniref:Orotidine-5'-phosphate decarboxylase n=1 Tax=Microlunatus kandeliicorticis TaxID=1759536 RepID=A0A7W3P6L4_9ACTN|nr:orotidine-5'-phosphate decarboxylase [Microlunatus kandeliicorticis]MBA8795089.1 orotidine-5'-phosphate decarboxylase [Microlunatus kandeliicorticis]
MTQTPDPSAEAVERPIAYGARLARAVAEHGPLCVGIDPHPSLLTAWGLSLDADGLERCGRAMVEAAAGRVALVKPQSAFFEAFGSAGIRALERVLADCRQAGLLSLLDVKRGDIGSTMDAYAAAYLTDGSALAADAVTLSPYLGIGSLDGAIATALGSGRGVYVLAATSNPEAADVQRARHLDGVAVAQAVVAAVSRANAEELATGEPGAWGSLGLVIGATIPAETVAALDLGVVSGPVLAPGIGAQGAGPDDLPRVFGAAARFVLPSSSRAVMATGPDPATLAAAVERTAAEYRPRT